MPSKPYYIIIAEATIIIVLTAVLISSHLSRNDKTTSGLLSPRVYQGIIKPKSFLIVNYAPLKNSIESFIKGNNLTVSVYVENLRTGAFIGINEREGYPPASLNKVLVAMLVMKEVEDGKLSMDSMIDIKEEDRSNTFGTLYKTPGKKLPLRLLMEKMLKESDNSAFNTLNRLPEEHNKALVMTYLDYYSDDSPDATKPGEDSANGLVTPKSIYNVFSSLYLSTVLRPESSEYILSQLTDTVFDIKELANLPENVTIAQKFATKYDGNGQFYHNCGIIYSGEMRLFYCIMTKDIEKVSAEKVIGAIVKSIYSYATDTRKTLDYYRDLYNYD